MLHYTKPLMIVASHKLAEVPSGPGYLPLHVGAAISHEYLQLQRDDDGMNISSKNASYCELTGTYWAWKNLRAPAVGLSHYRRYFDGTMPGPRGVGIMSAGDMERAMAAYDVVVAKPRHYVIETVESHYKHAHYGDDLEVLRRVIGKLDTQSSSALERILGGRRISLYNMFLMRRDVFEDYCEWLFSVLGKVEDEIDNSERSNYQARTFGYLGERLQNVWIEANRNRLKVGMRRVVNTDGSDALQKGLRFVMRATGVGGRRE